MQHNSTDFEKAVSAGPGILPKIIFAVFIALVFGGLYAKVTGLV
jgi:hypothetical protein